MDPYEPPAIHEPAAAEPGPGSPVFGDVMLTSDVAGLGRLKTLVRTRTGHGFIWVDEELVGRWWSLNPFHDQVEFAVGGGRVWIRYDWLPVFAATVWQDGRQLARLRYRRESLVYWGIQALAFAAGMGIVVGIALWWRYR